MDGGGGRTGGWPVIGGHPALDLCNTRSWRLDPARSVDRIDSPARLSDWYATVLRPGVGGAAAGPGRPRRSHEVSPGGLARTQRLRDATIAVLDAHLADDPAPEGALATITRARREAQASVRPSGRLPLTWTVDPAGARALEHELTLAVTDLLEHTDLRALRRCDGPGCGWLFLDHTRNHSRRWCDSNDCGNRARVRAYAQRRRDTASPG